MIGQRLRAFIQRLRRRSLQTHASVRVTDLDRALTFYRQLGFKQVTESRASEVVLLRHATGGELNLVTLPGQTDKDPTSDVTAQFLVDDLQHQFEQLPSPFANLAIIEDATLRRLPLQDPDGNRIEFLQHIDTASLAKPRVYHFATVAQLLEGLSEHYYLPPEQENQFILARPRAALLSLAAQRISQQTDAPLVLVQLDDSLLSLESQLLDDDDFDHGDRQTSSSYPKVNTPIPRQAITAIGRYGQHDGHDGKDEYVWPEQFVSLASFVAQPG